MADRTPMMVQYEALKRECPGALLFFRLGDFYELFGEDAKTASALLDLTLTTRDGTTPMCGVPHHAYEGYLVRLVELGHSVALCEQVEDPRQAKGLVKREIVRIVTPSTLLEGEGVAFPRRLAAIAGGLLTVGIAWIDVMSGQFRRALMSGSGALGAAVDELGRLGAAEVLIDPRLPEAGLRLDGLPVVHQAGSYFPARAERADVRAATACAAYLRATHPGGAPVGDPQAYEVDRAMRVDGVTLRSLEIVRRQDGGVGPGTLLGVVDETKTAGGRRLLADWMVSPLTSHSAIAERQGYVAHLFAEELQRARLRKTLGSVRDVDRLTSRIAAGSAGPGHLVQLGQSLRCLSDLKAVASGMPQLPEATFDVATGVAGEISALLDDGFHGLGRDGGYIRNGADETVDRLRSLQDGATQWMVNFEQRAKQESGIRNLKIGFNKVFGYYIEVSRAGLDRVPEDWERRQTLTTGERYITPDLKEQETLLLEAKERLVAREEELVRSLTAKVRTASPALHEVGLWIATLDVLASLAEVARKRRYVCPQVHEGRELEVRGGRHPVLEASIEAGRFVANDLSLDGERRVVVLTGPNMAGKSTYLRQNALIVWLAQIGSFVPADDARVGLADRVFTRIGAFDDLAQGRSTFMVEMQEVADILKGATDRSFILLDEIGRGTSTYDGMALAWAVVEDIHRIGARCLVATHYLELTSLEQQLPACANWSVAVAEEGEHVRFLRRVIPGPADRSYGIYVAQLAGVPRPVIHRASDLLERLQGEPAPVTAAGRGPGERLAAEIAEEIKALDVLRLTPLEALEILSALSQRLGEAP